VSLDGLHSTGAQNCRESQNEGMTPIFGRAAGTLAPRPDHVPRRGPPNRSPGRPRFALRRYDPDLRPLTPIFAPRTGAQNCRDSHYEGVTPIFGRGRRRAYEGVTPIFGLAGAGGVGGAHANTGDEPRQRFRASGRQDGGAPSVAGAPPRRSGNPATQETRNPGNLSAPVRARHPASPPP
jgi:hypothetical protein